MRHVHYTPAPARRAIEQLGRDLSSARRRQRIPMAIMAERASISRSTLSRIERGDPAVALGLYAAVLFVLGMTDRIASLASASADAIGADLAEEALPKRIHLFKPRPR